jgi:hypothetical protein
MQPLPKYVVSVKVQMQEDGCYSSDKYKYPCFVSTMFWSRSHIIFQYELHNDSHIKCLDPNNSGVSNNNTAWGFCNSIPTSGVKPIV